MAHRHGPEQDSPLAQALRPAFRRRPPDGYFLRAEFHAHFASLLDTRAADPDFEELAAAKVYAFLFLAAPLKIRGGTGSPIRPLGVAE